MGGGGHCPTASFFWGLGSLGPIVPSHKGAVISWVVCGFWCQQEKLPPSFSLHPEAADAAKPLDTTGPTEERIEIVPEPQRGY